jgi:CelD/BcsL family acetyltransferase involved in cellulose biosynthesis
MESAPRPERSPVISGLTTDVITCHDGLDALKDEWDSLLEYSDQSTFFLRWDWARLWWLRCSPESSRLFLITCRNTVGQLVGLAPFYWRRRSAALIPGIREILIIGTGTEVKSSEYTDVIARRGCELDVAYAIAKCLEARSDWDRLRLDELPQDSKVLTCLARAAGGGLRVSTSGRTHYIDTSTTADAFLQTLGRSTRHSLARRTRQLMSRHHCEFFQVDNLQALEAALDDLVRLHQARWNSIGQPGSFALPGFDAFLREAARFSIDKHLLRLWVLKVDSRPAAVVLAFFHNGVAHYFQGGFDPAHSKSSIGTVMLGLCINACIADPRVSVFDFMGGDDPYKDRWTRNSKQVYSAVWTRPSARAVAFVIQQWTVSSAKRVLRAALPPPVRARLVESLSLNSSPWPIKPPQSASSPSANPHELESSILDDEAAIDFLKDEWDELLRESEHASFFMRWQWTTQWWAKYAPPGSTPFLVVCRDASGRLAGLAPLYCRKIRTLGVKRVRELLFIGTGIRMRSSEHVALIARRGMEEEACSSIIRALTVSPHWDRLSLKEMATSSHIPSLIRDLLGPAASLEVSGQSHYIDAAEGWDAFRAGLGKSTRDNVSRYTRRLFAGHQCSFQRIHNNRELQPAMDALVRLHQARWNRKGHSGSFTLPHFEGFLRTAVSRSLDDESLRLWTLEVDSNIAAVLVGFLHNGVMHAFQAGFDPKYSRDSLGTVMLGLCIRACIEDPVIREFDFMGGDDLYKDKWTRKRRDTLSLTFERSNLRTRALAVQEQARNTMVRVLRALAPAPIKAAARRTILTHWKD